MRDSDLCSSSCGHDDFALIDRDQDDVVTI
jgi:hypothetical protein